MKHFKELMKKSYECVESNCNNEVSENGRKCRSCANRIRNLGRKRPDVSKRMKADKNPNWKGGLSKCIDCDKKLKSYNALRCKSCANKRKIFSKEQKQKMSFKAKQRIGEKNPFYGKTHSEKFKNKLRKLKIGSKLSQLTKNKISLSHKLENHWNWQGGKSFEPYPLGWTKTFKEQIRYRDKYKCQMCGVPEIECRTKLHIHHVDYDKNNLDVNNLISLCQSCHMKTNFNRNYWRSYFESLPCKA